MSKSLMKQSSGSVVKGAIPAVASGFLPGLGQLINGQTDKGIGVFAAFAVGGVVSMVPLIGWIGSAAAIGTWIYGVADGYMTGKKS